VIFWLVVLAALAFLAYKNEEFGTRRQRRARAVLALLDERSRELGAWKSDSAILAEAPPDEHACDSKNPLDHYNPADLYPVPGSDTVYSSTRCGQLKRLKSTRSRFQRDVDQLRSTEDSARALSDAMYQSRQLEMISLGLFGAVLVFAVALTWDWFSGRRSTA
jgi:hypothetical protein